MTNAFCKPLINGGLLLVGWFYHMKWKLCGHVDAKLYSFLFLAITNTIFLPNSYLSILEKSKKLKLNQQKLTKHLKLYKARILDCNPQKITKFCKHIRPLCSFHVDVLTTYINNYITTVQYMYQLFLSWIK